MKEEEIRPKKVFDQYIDLAIKDTKIFFKNSVLKKINCIACNLNTKKIFSKYNFQYHLCDNCLTIYTNPRPPESDFFNYYLNSKSSKYWASNFYKITAKARIKKIWRPKAKLINKIINKNKFNRDTQIIDIGGGYGLFADEIKKYFKNVKIVEPAHHLAAICMEKGHLVINQFLEKLKKSDFDNGKKVFVSFELIEHLHSPKKFFKKLNDIMKSRDIFIFTTLSGIGLDISTLGKNSNSIMPPYHINFYNPYSIEIFLKKSGFKILEITTPGKLDVDILKSNHKSTNSILWSYIFKTSDDLFLKKMQRFISQNNLSSHMMVVCKKNV